jgi:acyl carrier protein
MASYDSVLAQTAEIIGRYVDDVEITEATHIAKDLKLDSLEVMDLVGEIEDHFDITIPLNLLPEMQTVGDTAKRLFALIEAAGGAGA